MTNNQGKINQLLDKLEILLKKQDDFSREINNLRIEINRLKTTETERETQNEDIKHDEYRQQQTQQPSNSLFRQSISR